LRTPQYMTPSRHPEHRESLKNAVPKKLGRRGIYSKCRTDFSHWIRYVYGSVNIDGKANTQTLEFMIEGTPQYKT
jgi:hypothetical protein